MTFSMSNTSYIIANWLHIDSKLVISLFQYSIKNPTPAGMHGGYIKTKENFADMGITIGFCVRHSLTSLSAQNHRLVVMTTGRQVKLLHPNIA
jgi:hypothetical protein